MTGSFSRPSCHTSKRTAASSVADESTRPYPWDVFSANAPELPIGSRAVDTRFHSSRNIIVEVPTDWELTRVLGGAIGDYVTIARKERGGDDLYLGSVTDEHARTFVVPLDFLDSGVEYVASIYADGPGADWKSNPTPVRITREIVTAGAKLTIHLAPGGGQAIRLRPAGAVDEGTIPVYDCCRE